MSRNNKTAKLNGEVDPVVLPNIDPDATPEDFPEDPIVEDFTVFETVNTEEMDLILRAACYGHFANASGTAQKVTGGVYCQFRRNAETVHLTLRVPERFMVEAFTMESD